MRSNRMIRLVVLAGSLVAALSLTPSALAVGAQPTSIECPAGSTAILNPNPGPLYFPVGSPNPSPAAGRSNSFFTVNSGVFTVVSYLSWDGYTGRSNTTQLNEQWAIEIVGTDTVRTGLTTDIPDLVEEATVTGSFASIETTGGTVQFLHSWLYPGFTTDGSFNSVHPIGICFTLTEREVVTTTTTAPTTVAPTTLAPTTLAPTTTVPPETTTLATTTSTTLAPTTSPSPTTAAPTTLVLLVPPTTVRPTLPTTVAATPAPAPSPLVAATAAVPAPSSAAVTTVAPTVQVLGNSVSVAVEGDLAVTGGNHNQLLLSIALAMMIVGTGLVLRTNRKQA